MKFFYVAGLLTTLSSYSLIVAAVIGLCVSSSPAWVTRAIVILAISLLVTSSIVAVAYIAELLIAYIGANAYERAAFQARATGLYAWAYWSVVGASLVPQFFWVRRFRSRPMPALLISIATVLSSAIERAYTPTP
jgi:hypothetical protein